MKTTMAAWIVALTMGVGTSLQAQAQVFGSKDDVHYAAALWRAEKIHTGLVTDTVNLEGNPFTLPEVQTLLDGVTVGGHKLVDAEQVQNQSASWKTLVDRVRRRQFRCNRQSPYGRRCGHCLR